MNNDVIEVILIGLATALGLLESPLLVECAVASFPRRRSRVSCEGKRPAVDVLIPARNESSILPATLAALSSELLTEDRVWVVADNCTDNTAEIARSLGATTFERNDAIHRGKGFALQYAINQIAPHLDRVAVVVDADCQFERGGLSRIAALAAESQQPVQSCYRMLDSDPQPRVRLSQFAVLLKNTIRQRGLSRLGLPGLLSGSGMAFPWPILRAADLANDNTADDLQLTCDLAIAGHGVRYCEEAVIAAMLPSDPHVADVQRKRWIHGHLRTLARYVPRLIWAGITQRRLMPLAVAMEVAVPPISLLMSMHIALGSVCIAWGLLFQSWMPALVSLVVFSLIAAAISLAWARDGREVLPWRSLRAVPSHIMRSLIASIELPFRRQHWTPTPRDVNPLPHDG